MITKSQILEFRKYLKSAKNPLFFFDDDPDGLCSYLILKKYVGRGKGAVLKTTSVLDLNLFHKVEEYNPDVIFILDIPIVSQEFLDRCDVPVLWLDHHAPIKRKGVKYFNPMLKSENTIPTTYLAHKITEEKDLFLGTLGSISDWYFPEYVKEFSKKYPDLLSSKIKTPPEAIFDSKLGELINIFSLSLKKSTSKVHKIANLLLKIEDPYELLEAKTSRSKFIQREVGPLLVDYNKVIRYIQKQKPTRDKLFILELPKTKNSYTSTVSNYVIYKHPKKIIIIIRKKEDRIMMSLRSHKINIRDPLTKALEGLDGFGGGHENACGASINIGQFEEFIQKFKEYLK
jgi:single-stranded DNA-specific DHH superfamily exonuclease